MHWNSNDDIAKEGDLAQLAGLGHKYFLVRLKAGGILQTHRGVLKHDDLIGLTWGTRVKSHKGNPFYLLQPALAEILIETRRTTQIMYPKEIGFILVSMGIGPGIRVIEAGSGSGSLTTALANAVGDEGKVISYEVNSDRVMLAKRNVTRLGLGDRVEFKERDIINGFDETGVDALFLDVPNPYDYMKQVRNALKPGGFFGCILPTTNQVSRLLEAMREHYFAFVEVCEILLRYYRPQSDRLRPTDRMIGHTGFLIFARPVQIFDKEDPDDEGQAENNIEQDPVSSDEVISVDGADGLS